MRFNLAYALILAAVLTGPACAQDVTTTPAPAQQDPAITGVTATPATTQDATTSTIPTDEDTIESSGPISPEVQAIMNTPQPEGTPAAADTTNDIDKPGAPPPAMPAATENKPPEFEDTPQVELRILDKVRAESRTYVLNVGRTVAYANIRIRPRACRKSSPLDDPENAAFLQIWEVKPDQTSAWIFSGWMFASSPSLSGMDHPVYDVTVLDCKNPDSGVKSDSTTTTGESAPDDDSDLFTKKSVLDDGASADDSNP